MASRRQVRVHPLVVVVPLEIALALQGEDALQVLAPRREAQAGFEGRELAVEIDARLEGRPEEYREGSGGAHEAPRQPIPDAGDGDGKERPHDVRRPDHGAEYKPPPKVESRETEYVAVQAPRPEGGVQQERQEENIEGTYEIAVVHAVEPRPHGELPGHAEEELRLLQEASPPQCADGRQVLEKARRDVPAAEDAEEEGIERISGESVVLYVGGRSGGRRHGKEHPQQGEDARGPHPARRSGGHRERGNRERDYQPVRLAAHGEAAEDGGGKDPSPLSSLDPAVERNKCQKGEAPQAQVDHRENRLAEEAADRQEDTRGDERSPSGTSGRQGVDLHHHENPENTVDCLGERIPVQHHREKEYHLDVAGIAEEEVVGDVVKPVGRKVPLRGRQVVDERIDLGRRGHRADDGEEEEQEKQREERPVEKPGLAPEFVARPQDDVPRDTRYVPEAYGARQKDGQPGGDRIEERNGPQQERHEADHPQPHRHGENNIIKVRGEGEAEEPRHAPSGGSGDENKYNKGRNIHGYAAS